MLQYCFCFILVFWSQGVWDLSSPTRDPTAPLHWRPSFNHGTTREVLTSFYSNSNITRTACKPSMGLLRCWVVGLLFCFLIFQQGGSSPDVKWPRSPTNTRQNQDLPQATAWASAGKAGVAGGLISAALGLPQVPGTLAVAPLSFVSGRGTLSTGVTYVNAVTLEPH